MRDVWPVVAPVCHGCGLPIPAGERPVFADAEHRGWHATCARQALGRLEALDPATDPFAFDRYRVRDAAAKAVAQEPLGLSEEEVQAILDRCEQIRVETGTQTGNGRILLCATEGLLSEETGEAEAWRATRRAEEEARVRDEVPGPRRGRGWLERDPLEQEP